MKHIILSLLFLTGCATVPVHRPGTMPGIETVYTPAFIQQFDSRVNDMAACLYVAERHTLLCMTVDEFQDFMKETHHPSGNAI